ncbi:LIM and calponin homology domains-containing protein 1-like isoform X1 [Lates japonicus]
MASPVADIGQSHQHHPVTESAADSAFQEAQKWIEAVTGRCFGDKDFRGGLENGILLCELLSSIKPGLVKKINRLPTPIAGLDNLSVFLRGCEELGLKGSQLFDPGDLQDTSTRPTAKGSDCSRKLKNVLITIYWLGRAANGCTSYNGPTLDLKEFEGLLSQMRKEAEEAESPKRSIRDSGYIDCWDSERSDSLSPPRHGREDSFDSLDSFGSRSRQTPSPDVLVARGSSDGRGSDSESDGAPPQEDAGCP